MICLMKKSFSLTYSHTTLHSHLLFLTRTYNLHNFAPKFISIFFYSLFYSLFPFLFFFSNFISSFDLHFFSSALYFSLHISYYTHTKNWIVSSGVGSGGMGWDGPMIFFLVAVSSFFFCLLVFLFPLHSILLCSQPHTHFTIPFCVLYVNWKTLNNFIATFILQEPQFNWLHNHILAFTFSV